MRHLICWVLVLVAPVAPVAAKPVAAAKAEAALEQLLATDRAWSERAQDKDMVSALVAMMDRDAVLVLGGAADLIRGPEAIRARLLAKPGNATCSARWAPIGGGISADRSHGFTYGSMMVRPREGVPQALKYLAYWVKRPDGWRVFGYKRVGAKQGIKLARGGPIVGWGSRRSDDAGAALQASERAFSDEAQKIGLRAAFQKWGRPDSINLGAADSIAVGSQAIGEGVAGPDATSSVNWAADQVMVAPSGDLGLSFGLLHLNEVKQGQPGTIPFFTIWARPKPGDPWRYVAE